MGLARDRTCHLGTQGLQLLLGLVTAEAFQGSGEHPGLPEQRQATGLAPLTQPVHTEGLQLGVDILGATPLLRVGKKLAQRLPGFFVEPLALGQRQPVLTERNQRFQTARLLRQQACTGAGDTWNGQFFQQLGQAGAGRELGGQLAALLRLHAMFE